MRVNFSNASDILFLDSLIYLSLLVFHQVL